MMMKSSLIIILFIIIIVQTQSGPMYNGKEIITQYNLDVTNDTMYQQALGYEQQQICSKSIISMCSNIDDGIDTSYLKGNNTIANTSAIVDLNNELRNQSEMRFMAQLYPEYVWTEEDLDKNFEPYRNLTGYLEK